MFARLKNWWREWRAARAEAAALRHLARRWSRLQVCRVDEVAAGPERFYFVHCRSRVLERFYPVTVPLNQEWLPYPPEEGDWLLLLFWEPHQPRRREVGDTYERLLLNDTVLLWRE